MNKIFLLILIFFSINCYAITESESSSSKAISSQISNMVITQSAITAAALEAQTMNSQKNNSTSVLKNSAVAGVLTCGTSVEDIAGSGNWRFNGCKNSSIEEFFNKNKPSYATRITLIVFDREHEEFDIYYQ